MSRIVYVNGEYLPEDNAKISVFDRGFLFADAVYEVTAVLERRLVDFHRHIARLRRSMAELKLPSPIDDAELEAIHRTMVERNNLDEGLIYLQITRGPADRDFLFPENPAPGIVLFTQVKKFLGVPMNPVRILTVPDIRWVRRDIKTVQLLAPSMCKMMARAEGKDDAWMVQDGLVTEGTSNNAYIVTDDDTIITRNLSHDILHGITRKAVLDLAREAQFKIEERAFSVEEAQAAREAFITSAGQMVAPVVEIDDKPVGDGVIGPIVTRLREIYLEQARREAV